MRGGVSVINGLGAKRAAVYEGRGVEEFVTKSTNQFIAMHSDIHGAHRLATHRAITCTYMHNSLPDQGHTYIHNSLSNHGPLIHRAKL